MIRFGATMLGLAIVLLASALAEATTAISTGPVRLDSGDGLVCIAANTSSKNVTNVVVKIQFKKADGSSNGDSLQSCVVVVAPGETCANDNGGTTNDFSAFCEVSFSGGNNEGHPVQFDQGSVFRRAVSAQALDRA